MNGYTDIHCHLLPGVDDGAETTDEALALLRRAYRDGTRAVILTPHHRGRCRPQPEKLRERLDELQAKMPQLQLYLGCEVHYQADIGTLLDEGKVLTLCGSSYCLLEFSRQVPKSVLLQGTSQILSEGYIPILAHAERYAVICKEPSLADELVYMGARIQLNATSVLGKSGWGIKRCCTRLLKDGLVHFIASDAHNGTTRPPELSKCYEHIKKRFGAEYAEQLFSLNARHIMENTTI